MPDDLDTFSEIMRRCADGLEVRLMWERDTDALVVAVVDWKLGDAFDVAVLPGERPRDVFAHPFAYAALHRDSRPARVTALAARLSHPVPERNGAA
jgi:hypothetical protein